MRPFQPIVSALLLGFGLGGFLDGILLHQILQWHHLLSLVPGVDDLRAQVLWDGVFHIFMYVVVAGGLWGLWRAHRSGSGIGEPTLYGALRMGAGSWHIVDGVLSHWVLGIHRIKIDADQPLLWDLGWFAIFGILPVLVGWRIWRGGGPRTGRRRQRTVLIALSVLGFGAGLWSMQPPPDQPFITVVFRPGQGGEDVLAALTAANASLVWADGAMGVVVVDIAPARRWTLYRHGAIFVSGSATPAGCFGWSSA